MKPKDLVTVWSSPDNSRLTSKQYSFRLPVHVAAKIAALCEMYPTKSRTQIVGDLLSVALQGVEEGFAPVMPAEGPDAGDDGDLTFRDAGPQSLYCHLANKHNEEMEREMGNDDPQPIVLPRIVSLSDFKKP